MAINSSAAPGRGKPQEKTVLIASNDETLGELLYYIVHKEGFRTEKTDSRGETIDKARGLRPELIILALPLDESFAVLRELQTDDAVNIPIILLANREIDQAGAELVLQEPNVKGLLQQTADTAKLAPLLHKLLKTQPPDQKKNT